MYPPLSICAKPHIAVVDVNVDRKGTRAAAEAYLQGQIAQALAGHDVSVSAPDGVRVASDLCQIATMQGEYRLSPSARKWGHDWYGRHWTDARPLYMASDRYGGYHSRKQTHIHKLAIVLAAARNDSLIIEREYLEEADLILSSAEKHMIKVFDSIGMVDEARHAAELVSYVKAHSFLTSDHLYKLVQNIMTQKDFDETIRAAVRGGHLDVEVRQLNGATVRGVVPGKKLNTPASPSSQTAASPPSASASPSPAASPPNPKP